MTIFSRSTKLSISISFQTSQNYSDIIMYNYQKFYINGQWVAADSKQTLSVINPATEQSCGEISIANEKDVDLAVTAAKNAFASYSTTTVNERIELFEQIITVFKKRYNDLAEAISTEMGAPISLATKAQTGAGLGHIKTALEVLRNYKFEYQQDHNLIVKEPIGVCGLITPWNWPLNQITCKVSPALATGCTMVLKPSEIAPVSACIFAEILDEAGVPAGVFNLVNGDGPVAGTALSKHPDVDMMSFTGSTRAGALVAQNAAPTIKRVTQELGGKSANILLEDVDLEQAVKRGVISILTNSGQSCNAPTRMLVPENMLLEAESIAEKFASASVIGDPSDENTKMGPVVSEAQFNKIQDLIQSGIDEGAKLVCGGTGKPEGIDKGYYIKPTIFSQVNNQMRIAREEIFGPVLCIIPYKNIDQAIEIANDTPYGLAGYIQGNDPSVIKYIASKVRAGNIYINGQTGGLNAPFGGYKQSGNGRECGEYGFEDFLEIKSISGTL